MPELSPEVITLLQNHSWENTIPRLVRYALSQARVLCWQGIWNGDMPGGREAEDIVDQAIEKVFSGRRAWNPHAQPDLFIYLKSVVDSEVSHLVESWENKYIHSESSLLIKEDTSLTGEGDRSMDYFAQIATSAPSPIDDLLLQEHERLGAEFYWGFYESLDKEPLLQKVVECIFDDVKKRAAIAERLKVPPKEIDNIRKQLNRRLKDYRIQWNQERQANKGGKKNG